MIREQYLALLFNGPLVPADAMVVLSGDGTVRYDAAVGLLRQRVAHWVVLSGGLDDPPHSLSAEAARDYMTEKGLADHRMILEGASQNTHEQGEAIARLAKQHGWHAVLLITSAYHLPRAYLTVLKSILDAGLGDDVALIPFPAYANWQEPPPGLKTPRADLVPSELLKVDEYADHVATYKQGIAHLRRLERDDG